LGMYLAMILALINGTMGSSFPAIIRVG